MRQHEGKTRRESMRAIKVARTTFSATINRYRLCSAYMDVILHNDFDELA